MSLNHPVKTKVPDTIAQISCVFATEEKDALNLLVEHLAHFPRLHLRRSKGRTFPAVSVDSVRSVDDTEGKVPFGLHE